MTDHPAIIFHHTLPIDPDPRVGSTTHVVRMLEGFTEAGYEIEVVAGYSNERNAAMRSLRDQITRGRRFALLYSEASTAPTAMNDPHHLPLHPFADWRFLRSARRHGIPVGLFYPDAHWRYDIYTSKVPLAKRLPAAVFYHYDLRWYRDAIDLLFLPSQRMRESVPGWHGSTRVWGLAPGATILDSTRPPSDVLRLLYVGAVTPPLYDIGPLLDAVTTTPGVELTLCCPPAEVGQLAPTAHHPSVTIVHEFGEGVRKLYMSHDVACLVYEDHPYRTFAMPVKLFEAIGAGIPSLISGGSSAAEFVAGTGTGWVVGHDGVAPMLRTLRDRRELVTSTSETVAAVRHEHTWRARAEYVAGALQGSVRQTSFP